MKCLGLIGGIGWEPTVRYYRILNEEARNRYGTLHSARVIVNSLDFEQLDRLVRAEQWNEAASILADAARTLETAGAEGLVLCSNLLHQVSRQIQAAVSIPLLHIGDAILGELRGQGLADIGLLGARFTLEHRFLLDRPRKRGRWGPPRIHIPPKQDRERLDRIIYGELCLGSARTGTRDELLRMIGDLRSQGAKVVVLAATELSAGLRPEDFTGTLFDSVEIHALFAARWAMDEPKKPDFSGISMSTVPGDQPAKRSRSNPPSQPVDAFFS